MSTPLKTLFVVAALLASVAAILVIREAMGDSAERAALAERAAHWAEVARAADAEKDYALATHAWSVAVQAAPEAADWQAALVAAQAERILAAPEFLNGANALGIQTSLEVAVRGGAPGRVTLALGRLLQFRGATKLARKRYEEAVAAAPEEPLAHLLVGDALLKANELDPAAAALEKALALEEGMPLAEFALGQTRLAQKKPDAAAPLLQSAAKKLPRNANVFVSLGGLHFAKESWEEAIVAFERAMSLNPNLTTVYARLGEAYLRTNRIEPGLGALMQAWDRNGDIDALRLYGRVVYGSQSWADVLQVYSRIRAVLPQDPEANCRIAAALDAAKDPNTLAAWQACARLAKGQKGFEETLAAAQARIAALEETPAKR